MEISDLIRVLRKNAGLSQAALAGKLGVNKSAVAQWELGTTRLTNANFAALKLELGINEDIVIADSSPFEGKLIERPSEISLIDWWRSLTEQKRRFVIELLQIGQKIPPKNE